MYYLTFFILCDLPSTSYTQSLTLIFFFTELTSEGCPPPQLALNGTETEEGELRIRKDYTRVREVKFFGSIGPLNERRLCKIKCIEGQWVGPLCVDQHGE